ncbi:MAG: hypothetical protein ACKVS8_10860 [Phycisphaerales bacterium]
MKLACALACASLFISGCEREGASANKPAPPTAPAAAASAKGEPSAVYTVRGRVADVLTPGRPQSDFKVHHEAIDTFADGAGKVVGMSAMVMPFPLGPGVTADGVAVGDIVEITFPVWWNAAGPEYHLTKIVKLPADTKLEFRAAKPPTSGG